MTVFILQILWKSIQKHFKYSVIKQTKKCERMWRRMKIDCTAACFLSVALYRSSFRRQSSSSWILFSSWESPAVERDWPSMSATRLLSSFSCREIHGQAAGQQYPEYTRVEGQNEYILNFHLNGVQLVKCVFQQTEAFGYWWSQMSDVVCVCVCTCLSMAFLSSSRSCLEDLSCMSSERSWSIWSLLLATRSVIISTLLFSSSSSNSTRFSLSWQRQDEINSIRRSERRLCVLCTSHSERSDGNDFGHVSM